MQGRSPRHQGFTVVEILIVVAAIGTLCSVALPLFMKYISKSRVVRSVVDMHAIDEDLGIHYAQTGHYPETLEEIHGRRLLDPWGSPYQYFNYVTRTGNGLPRQDRFLAPLNTDYELYSLGPDGLTTSVVTRVTGPDDIVRAHNGAYLGPAWEY